MAVGREGHIAQPTDMQKCHVGISQYCWSLSCAAKYMSETSKVGDAQKSHASAISGAYLALGLRSMVIIGIKDYNVLLRNLSVTVVQSLSWSDFSTADELVCLRRILVIL